MIAKICGVTRLADALHAAAHGATAVGFVFWPRSPRFIEPERAAAIVAELPGTVTAVGVFVNQPVEEVRAMARASGVAIVQLHGDEPPSYAGALACPFWRALAASHAADVIDAWPVETTILLDAHDPVRRGGTGRRIDWTSAAELAGRRRVVLAGGLTPANVRDAVRMVRPAGVDVSSGVEEAPGIKNPDKVARFLAEARAAFHGS